MYWKHREGVGFMRQNAIWEETKYLLFFPLVNLFMKAIIVNAENPADRINL
jgi:hypothetical protein